MKKFIVVVTAITVGLLPLTTASAASAAPRTFSAASIGSYCC